MIDKKSKRRLPGRRLLPDQMLVDTVFLNLYGKEELYRSLIERVTFDNEHRTFF